MSNASRCTGSVIHEVYRKMMGLCMWMICGILEYFVASSRRLQGLKMPQPDPPPLLGKDLAGAKMSFRHKMRYNIRVIASMILWKSC